MALIVTIVAHTIVTLTLDVLAHRPSTPRLSLQRPFLPIGEKTYSFPYLDSIPLRQFISVVVVIVRLVSLRMKIRPFRRNIISRGQIYTQGVKSNALGTVST